MKQFPLIVKALLKQKAVCFLTVFQVAITFAVLVNSYASIDQYGRVIDDDMGIAQGRLIGVEIEMPERPTGSTGGPDDSFYRNAVQRTTQLLEQVPGVTRVSVTDGLPMTNDAMTAQVRRERDSPVNTAITLYSADEQFLATAGVAVTSGRYFEPEETTSLSSRGDVTGVQPVVIVSRPLGDLLFPGEDPLNKQLWVRDRSFSIVGVVDELPGLHALWSNARYSAYLPARLAAATGNRFLVRVDDDADVSGTVVAIERQLLATPNLVEYIGVHTLDQLKAASLTTAVFTLKVLGFISAVVLVVSALGIYGQATFNVTKRTRETGIKRALGSSKADVVGYYLTENWLVSTVGILLGLFLALVLNYVLVQGLGASRIDGSFIVPTAIFVWLVGLVASLLPARRAARISPALATRTV